mmetsp:Transcript_36832/g.91703  ORF Transcript_36832/g.91703 Transcript_36832/m.91703 type:complete len:219 (-) Transcript_36832:505-1161(-)
MRPALVGVGADDSAASAHVLLGVVGREWSACGSACGGCSVGSAEAVCLPSMKAWPADPNLTSKPPMRMAAGVCFEKGAAGEARSDAQRRAGVSHLAALAPSVWMGLGLCMSPSAAHKKPHALSSVPAESSRRSVRPGEWPGEWPGSACAAGEWPCTRVRRALRLRVAGLISHSCGGMGHSSSSGARALKMSLRSGCAKQCAVPSSSSLSSSWASSALE